LIGSSDPNTLDGKIEIDLVKLQNQDKVDSNLKRALHIINSWLTKNTGNAEQIKALKM